MLYYTILYVLYYIIFIIRIENTLNRIETCVSSRSAGGNRAISVSIADVYVSYQTHSTTTHWYLSWIFWPSRVQKKTLDHPHKLHWQAQKHTKRRFAQRAGGLCRRIRRFWVRFRPNHVLLSAGFRPGPGAQTGARVSVPQAQQRRIRGRETKAGTARVSMYVCVCKVQFNDGSPALRLFSELWVSVRVCVELESGFR